MLCSNGWRCGARPVAAGLFCSLGGKNFVSVNPVRLWPRQAHVDSNPSVLCQDSVDLGGDNCPSVTQESSPSLQA